MSTPLFSEAPKRRPTHGPCPRCGFLAELDHLGYIGAHLQIRIKGFDEDGRPRERRTTERCDGEGAKPEAVA